MYISMLPQDQKRNELQLHIERTRETISNILLFLMSSLGGYYAVTFAGSMDFSVSLGNIHLLVLVTLFASLVMLWKLRPTFKDSRTTLFVTTMTIAILAVIIRSIAVETTETVEYDGRVMGGLAIAVYFLALLPFFTRRPIVSYHGGRAERDSIFLAASVMWISPFLAELAMYLRWFLSNDQRIVYMTLGGAGIKDVLVFYGFRVLVSALLFHTFRRLCVRIMESDFYKRIVQTHYDRRR